MTHSPDRLNSRFVMVGRTRGRKEIREKWTDPETHEKTSKDRYAHMTVPEAEERESGRRASLRWSSSFSSDMKRSNSLLSFLQHENIEETENQWLFLDSEPSSLRGEEAGGVAVRDINSLTLCLALLDSCCQSRMRALRLLPPRGRHLVKHW